MTHVFTKVRVCGPQGIGSSGGQVNILTLSYFIFSSHLAAVLLEEYSMAGPQEVACSFNFIWHPLPLDSYCLSWLIPHWCSKAFFSVVVELRAASVEFSVTYHNNVKIGILYSRRMMGK